MKSAISKFLLLTLAVVGLGLFMLMAMGTTYTYYLPTSVQAGSNALGASYDFIYLSHTFVATTDTVYFRFRIATPHNVQDTIIVAGNLATKGVDSVRCVWAYQYSYDGSAWSSALALGTDSTATSASVFSVRSFIIGRSLLSAAPLGVFSPPYNRISCIGATAAGGKSNKVGNVARLHLTKAS